MRRVALAAVAAVISAYATHVASAQDIFRQLYAPAPVASWTGFYVGGNVGYGWAKDGSTAESNVPGASASSFTMKGMVAGGQLGMNVQVSGPWVVGIETDIQGSWQKFDGPGGNLSNLNAAVGFAPPTTESVSIDWFGTTRGRLGYALDKAMIYGTAGVAYGGVKTQGGVGGFTQINETPVKFGWVAGGGVEFLLSRNWVMKGEYLHIDFGGTNDTYTALGGAITATLHQRITDDIVRFGVNYMFR